MCKKYVASRVQRWASIGFLPIFSTAPIFAAVGFYLIFLVDKPSVVTILGIPVSVDEPPRFVYVLLSFFEAALICCTAVFFQHVWKFFDDPILGKVSFDTKAVTFYTPSHIIVLPYSECAEIGFTKWYGDTVPGRYVYYIYFSKMTLNDDQRAHLFEGRSKTKRGKRNMPLYQSEYVLFQYRSEVFADFIECVPMRFRTNLIETAESLQLDWYEKVLHK